MAVTPLVAIVGRANVGKSSLFNRLIGQRLAITAPSPGTTRDAITGVVSWSGSQFMLTDTAGLGVISRNQELDRQIEAQISSSLQLADLILVVVEANNQTNEDKRVAKAALKTGKPVLLVLNKIDAAREVEDHSKLGIKSQVKISALSGRGTGDLLDHIMGYFPVKITVPSTTKHWRLAFVGRPNVGKSSLFNRLAQNPQAIVTSQAGTTRDTITAQRKYYGQTVELIDTAGLRRRGQIEPGIEKFSSLRTAAAISRSDVCCLVMDALEPAVAGDRHIAGLVMDAGKGLILTLNKCDLVDQQPNTLTKKTEQQFQFAWWAPLVLTSAETGLNTSRLLQLANQIHKRRGTKITTSVLNQTFRGLIESHPPAGLRGRHPKINYVTQTGIHPPKFALFGSALEQLHFSYHRYLENGLRKNFDFVGTPVTLELRSTKSKIKQK